MPPKPKSYGQAHEQALALLDAARLEDPNEHFPYKHAAVTRLLEEDPPMGSGVPDQADGTNDTTRTVKDYMSQGIADASRDYIDAQAAFLANRSPETLDAYEAARDRLLAARFDHRANRGSTFVVGAAARRAG